MRTPPLSALALLAAAALGYVVGNTRPTTAEASPVVQESTNGTYITESAEGGTLTFWQLKDGRPVQATSYACTGTMTGDSAGSYAEVRQLVVRGYAPEPTSTPVTPTRR
jgi:hypothetical protein